MRVEEFYLISEGDYSDVMKRFIKEERILKYLNMFYKDNSREEIRKALDEKDYEQAFRICHNLKGLCLNLALKGYFDKINILCEELRPRVYSPYIEVYYNEADSKYRMVMENLKDLFE